MPEEVAYDQTFAAAKRELSAFPVCRKGNLAQGQGRSSVRFRAEVFVGEHGRLLSEVNCPWFQSLSRALQRLENCLAG